MERPLNRIAVLVRPTDQPPYWEYPVEEGLHDHRPNFSHGGKYGNGGFTGERCMSWPDGTPHFFRLDDHDRRLEESVAAYRYLHLGCSRELRDQARFTLATKNSGDNYLSMVFESRGDVGVYPKPTTPLIYANTRDMDPLTRPYLPLAAMEQGLRLMICDPEEAHRRYPTRLTMAKTSGNYGDSNVAKHLALQMGYDDAILLDWTRERISELTVSNLVLFEDDRLVTPFRDCAPLNGITKQTIGTIAAERFRLHLDEEAVPIGRLSRRKGIHGGSRYQVRAAFATGTAIGVVKIRTICNFSGELLWELEDQEAERVVDQLTNIYWCLLRGQEPGYHPDWFTPVPADIMELHASPDTSRRTIA